VGKRPRTRHSSSSAKTPFAKKEVKQPTQLEPAINNRPDILQALEESQPYFGHDGATTDYPLSPLWMLHRLDIIDKHRLLLIVACVLDHKMWWGADESDPIPDLRINSDPLEEGNPVAWFDFHGVTPPSNFHPNASLQIAINEPVVGRMRFESVVEVLKVFIGTVEGMVDFRFRPLFF
jgi:hypothetical protein